MHAIFLLFPFNFYDALLLVWQVGNRCLFIDKETRKHQKSLFPINALGEVS